MGQRPRERFEVASDAELGLAWYSRQAWERLRQVADDSQALDDTYQDWQRGALRAIRDLKSTGRKIRKVSLNIDALLAWCHERNLRIDSAARAEYVVYLLQQAHKDAKAPTTC